MDPAGRVFLVTGGSSGLGAASAARLVAAGAQVVVADIDEELGQSVVARLGGAAEFVKTDVTDAVQVQAAIDAAQQRGAFCGALNCAGVLGAGRIVSRDGPFDLDYFSRVIGINLVGTFNVMRLAAAAMIADPGDDDERGVVINTSSAAAFEGQVGQAAYSASKGGVAAMSLPAAREFARFKIRVAAIAPGIFSTPMMEIMPEAVQASLQAQTVFPPRPGQASEFAELALHIIQNPMINGTTIRLDGAVRLSTK